MLQIESERLSGMTTSRLTHFKALKRSTAGLTTEQVVRQVRELIRRGDLRPGDRLPSERELAKRLGISRPSLRTGLRFLAALGVLRSRHGAGTFIADGPPALDSEPLNLMAALHGFTPDEMFEARRVLDVGLAGLAAERATEEQLATLAEEVAEMYASIDDPREYLIHDLQFHRAVAAASCNPILTALMEMVTAGIYEGRRERANGAADVKASAGLHRKVYKAIRARNAAEARAAMGEHLDSTQRVLRSVDQSGASDSKKRKVRAKAS